jgi:CRP-like cAMP-binding protein
MAGSGNVSQTTGNALLDQAPDEVKGTLLPSSRPHEILEGEILLEAAEPIKAIYLPTSGIISLVTTMREGSAVEAGLVGREGFAGISALLGREPPGNIRAMGQIPGDALEVDVDTFLDAFASSTAFRDVANGYINAVWAETAQTVACNRLHSVNERCARWLLLVQDRLGRSDFRLTQEFLAVMLGIRRPSVSVAAETMQKREFISYHRGQMRILDREGMKDSACECYSIIRAEMDHVLPGALGPT